MIVNLTTIRSCYQPVIQERPHFCREGEEYDGIEVEGDEGWLKFFNATDTATGKPIGAVKSSRTALLPTDIGAGTQPSVEKVLERMSVPTMVAKLKEAGLKLANVRWKPETLASHIIKRQLHNT